MSKESTKHQTTVKKRFQNRCEVPSPTTLTDKEKNNKKECEKNEKKQGCSVPMIPAAAAMVMELWVVYI